MKIIKYRNFKKLFESNDDDSIIPEGFKYSWNDIYESLLYLTDIGFEIDEKSQKRYLTDEDGEEVKGEYVGGQYNREWKSNIEKGKRAIYEIRLFKKKESGRLKRQVKVGSGYSSNWMNYYLDSDVDGLISIYEEIASFCARFDKAYHNLVIKEDGYSIWLVASNDVSSDFITKRLDEELNDRVERALVKHLEDNFDRFSSNNKSYTKKFREDFFGGYRYELEGGIAVVLFNWDSVTKGVYKTNSETFNEYVAGVISRFNDTESWKLGKYGYKAEFRELKSDDIEKLKGTSLERAQRYIGKKCIIVKFDYQKVFNIIKKDLSKR